VAGGCATQFARGSGSQQYCFDVGLHYIGDCAEDGAIPRLMRGVGADVEFVAMDDDGFDTLVFPDFRFRIPANLELYRERLLDGFPSQRRGIDRYVRLVRELMLIGQQVEQQGGKLRASTLLQVAMHGRLLAANQRTTIGQFLDGCTHDPKLRAVMLGQHGDYALPPSEVSALLHAGLAAHYFKGAYYPKGGGQVLADALAAIVEECGGSIHLRRGVSRILIEDGRAVGVCTEARKRDDACEVRADMVISNADIRRTMLELVGREHLPMAWRDRVYRFRMAGALFMTYLGVRGDLRDDGMTATNFWQFDDYDTEGLYRSMRESQTVEPRAAYITSASIKDPETASHAPDGVTNVEVMTLVDGDPRKWGVQPDAIEPWSYKKGDGYLEVKRRVEDDMIDRLDALFPGSRERVVFRESATPVTHSRYTRATAGTGYGLAATPDQFMQSRPGYRGPIDGLFLCGASTRAGHGIVGAMLGGHHCARYVKRTLSTRRG
jgi:phytoene dehydrogenase-like protein